MHVYTFSNWQAVEKALTKSNVIGFAMPMTEDQFKVHRFQLDGLTQAVAKVETTFFAAIAPATGKPAGSKSSTVSETL